MSFEKQFVIYGSYHANPVNIFIHVTTVPLIVLTSLIFLVRVPILDIPYGNLASLLVLIYSMGYIYLHTGIGLFGSLILLSFNVIAHEIGFSDYNGMHVWQLSLIVHIISWIAQLLGHSVFEKRSPAFLDNLLIAFFFAPLFVFAEVLFYIGFYKDFSRKINVKVKKEIANFKRNLKKIK